MTIASTRRSHLSDFIALSLLAIRARYTLSKPARVLFLLGAMFDPFVYAGVIYFVVERVFGLSGFDRFQFLLIGIISFRWTLSCLLDAVNLAELERRMAEAGRARLVAALVVMAPPSAVMLLSLAAALVFSLIVDAPDQSFRALGWLAPVILVQGAWNLALVLVVDRLSARFRIASEAPLVILAGLMWMLSPVMYKFGDIPPSVSALFTTFNPASHVLAAYYRAYWYGLPIGLNVLPAAIVVSLAIVAWLGTRPDRFASSAGAEVAQSEDESPHLVIATDGRETATATSSVASYAGATPFRQWTGTLKAFTGRDMAALIGRTWPRSGTDLDDTIARIRRTSRLDRLFDDYLSLYPDWALAQLAFAVAVESDVPVLIFDGVLDASDLVFRRAAWERLIAETERGRRVIVVTYRLLGLPGLEKGRFTALSGTAVVGRGAIGPELAQFYLDMLEGEGRARDGRPG